MTSLAPPQDLAGAMALADVTLTYWALPPLEQIGLSAWISRAHTSDTRQRRIASLVLALRIGQASGFSSSDFEGRSLRLDRVEAIAVLDLLTDTDLLLMSQLRQQDVIVDPTHLDAVAALEAVYELLAALDKEGVLAAFMQLPKKDQAAFLRWVTMVPGAAERATRIKIFAMALKHSPLAPRSQVPTGLPA